MVAKLIKHEFLRTWRVAVVSAAAALLICLAGAFGGQLLPSPLNGIIAAISLIVAVVFPFAVSLLLGIDFYRSCYSKTGYFTAAIPVSGGTIFWSKLGYAYVVALASLLYMAPLLLLAMIGFGGAQGSSVQQVLDQVPLLLEAFGGFEWWVQVLVLLTILLYPLTGLAQYFLAATWGSESRFASLGLGGPVLVWFLYYLASQAVAVIGIFIPPSLDVSGPAPKINFDFGVVLAALESNASILPLVSLILVFLLAIAGLLRAKSSYANRLDLR